MMKITFHVLATYDLVFHTAYVQPKNMENDSKMLFHYKTRGVRKRDVVYILLSQLS